MAGLILCMQPHKETYHLVITACVYLAFLVCTRASINEAAHRRERLGTHQCSVRRGVCAVPSGVTTSLQVGFVLGGAEAHRA